MKRLLTIATVVTGVLLLSAAAQEPSTLNSPNGLVSPSERQELGNSNIPSSKMQEMSGPRDAQTYSEDGGGRGEGTIAIDVWSSASNTEATRTEAQPEKLSPQFSVTALRAALGMQWTERRLENSIKRGYPLVEFWVQADLQAIDDSVELTTLSATNDADRQALEQLQNEKARLHLWCDWLIDANRNLRLGDYYMSGSTIDGDVQFQNSLTCTKFLVSMFASRTLAEDSSCL